MNRNLINLAFILSALTCSIFSCTGPQVEKKTYVFKEIGWRIKVPTHFIIDSSAATQDNRLVEDKIQEYSPDSIRWKPSINFIEIKKDNRNVLSSAIARQTNMSRKDFEENRYRSLLASMRAFQSMPTVTSIDTISSTAIIGGLEFYRFYFRITYSNQMVMNTLYHSRIYKGYDVAIFFSYTDTKIGGEFYEILNDSEFY